MPRIKQDSVEMEMFTPGDIFIQQQQLGFAHFSEDPNGHF